MRKLLLTSTALVAATSMINYASADVSVSGGFEWGYTSQKSDIAATDGDNFRNDNEVVITFTNKTDTGLTITGRYDVDGDTATVDESSITIAGGFGSIRLGNDDGAEDAFGINEGDLIGEEAAYAVGSASVLTNAGETGNTNGNKITYFTPAMGAFKAGVSFTDSGQPKATATDRTSMGASYTMGMGEANVVFEYNQGSTETSTSGQSSTDHTNYGATVTMGAISVIVSAATQEDGVSDNEAVGAAIKYDLGGGMYVAGSTVDSEDDLQIQTSGSLQGPESYEANMLEVGYTVAPGLQATVTGIDYHYLPGGNSLPSGQDSGSAIKLTLSASF